MDINPAAPDSKLPEAPRDAKRKKCESSSGFESVSSSGGLDHHHQNAIRKSINEMITSDELPINIVDGIGFRRFMAIVCPKFAVPSRWEVAKDRYRHYAAEKFKLKELLKTSPAGVSLTVDTWESLQKVNYLCLKAHFIDKKWKLNRKILNFLPISSHEGEAVGKLVRECLQEWEINRVFAVIGDRSCSNDAAFSFLKKSLSKVGTCIQEGKYFHLRYIADFLNIIVIEGLKEIDESVSRIRGAVRYVRESPSRLIKFKQCVLFENIQSKSMLCLDVDTRWDSTNLMLDVAQKFERAFEEFEYVDTFYRRELKMGAGVPEIEDWGKVRKFCLFLRKIYDLTIKVSGSSDFKSTNFLDEICLVHCTLLDWQTGSDAELKVMAKQMKDKFDKYLGNVEKVNMLLYIAPILDPRKKLEFVRFCFMHIYSPEQASVMIKNVKEAIEGLFEEYKKMSQTQSKKVNGSSQVRQIKKADDSGLGQKVWEKFKSYKKEIDKEDKRTELDRYFSEKDPEDYDGFDVLNWWKLNGSRFPVLSNVARDVLAAPVSTITSEYAFSTGGRVLDTYTSSLTPRLVQALVCMQDWRRESSRSDDTKEDLEELDKLEMDLSKIDNGDLE